MDDYLKLAKEIADESAKIAIKYFGFNVEQTWKRDNTPLTKADTEINRPVIQKINVKYPEHSVLGEEESSIKENSRYVWICDPVDGTMPFSCGLPMFTFSLALVDQRDGQPILGIVNDPVMKNMYFASKGGGAYRNSQKIFVTKQDTFDESYLSVDDPTTKNSIGLSGTSIMEALGQEGGKVMKLVSFVYGGIQVANGKFVGSIFFGPYARDVAALKIITEEAGGKVTDLKGRERRYDEDGFGAIVSNGVLHENIVSIISKYAN